MQSIVIAGGLVAYSLLQPISAQTPDCSQTCQSFGLDFMDGGAYFQNSLSSDNFTAFEDFESCQDDYADNILVDPNGDQYYCNDVQMTPDDTQQLVTCPILKSDLIEGTWSILVLSNNGACGPIDYIRTFYLSVGPQITVTVGGTMSVTTTTTPILSQTTILSQTVTVTAPPITNVVPNTAVSTTTFTPFLPSFTVTTNALATITDTATVLSTATTTATAACIAKVQDKVNTEIEISVEIKKLLHLSKREAQPMAGINYRAHRRAVLEARLPSPEAIAAVEERSNLQKRHPDQMYTTISVVPSVTITVTSTALASILTVPVTSFSTTTLTPTMTVTVTSGKAKVVTVTSSKIVTATFYIPFTTTGTTVTRTTTSTVTGTALCT